MITPFLEKWLTALRGGRYRQARECLCRIDGGQRSYCCLGVGARVLLPDEVWKTSDDEDAVLTLLGENACPGFLEWTQAMAEIGIRVSDGGDLRISSTALKAVLEGDVLADALEHVPNALGTASIMVLNDEVGLDFKQIADLLEYEATH